MIGTGREQRENESNSGTADYETARVSVVAKRVDERRFLQKSEYSPPQEVRQLGFWQLAL